MPSRPAFCRCSTRNWAMARSSPVGLGMLVSSSRRSASSERSIAAHARCSHASCSADSGMEVTGGWMSVAVNASSRVVYAGRDMAVYNDASLSSEVLELLRARVRGVVIGPSDAEYEVARRVWNARVDRRPGAIVRCADAADVVAAVGLARQGKVALAVRGGGHDVASNGT